MLKKANKQYQIKLVLKDQSDLKLFCLHMLFLSNQFGSGIQKYKDCHLIIDYAGNSIFFQETKNVEIFLDQSDLELFCLHMLFLSSQFGSGIQKVKDCHLIVDCAGNSIFFQETKNVEIFLDQSDLELFCLHMLFLSSQFGSGIQKVKDCHLIIDCAGNSIFFQETKNVEIFLDQSDLELFCLHMLFLSSQFGSGIQKVKDCHLIIDCAGNSIFCQETKNAEIFLDQSDLILFCLHMLFLSNRFGFGIQTGKKCGNKTVNLFTLCR